MSTARLWTLGAVVAILGILGAVVGVVIQPNVAAASAADAGVAAAKTQNVTTTAEIARLTRLAATQSKLDAQEEELWWAVPTALRMNSLSRLLRDTAAADGVEIEAFTPSSPTSYAPSTVDASAPVASTTSSSDDSSADASSATATTAPVVDPKSPWFGTTDPAITAQNLTVVPLSVTVKGDLAGVQAFASDAQQLRRLFAVTNVSTELNKDAGTTVGIVSGFVYTLDR